MSFQNHTIQVQRGFTLIEAMISLVILSIGLLGVAAMQSLGLRLNYDALQRTQATTLAYDIAENMRLDPSNALLLAASNPYAGTLSAAGTSANCNNSSTTAADIKVCWQVALRERLPTGTITITAPPTTANPTLTLRIAWTESWIEKGDTAADTSFQTFTFQIRNGS